MNTNASSVNLFALASSVAQHLPGSWTIDSDSGGPFSYTQRLTRASDGLKLFLAGNVGGWAPKGKLRVSFSRPRHDGKWIEVWDKNEKLLDPEIGMSETKSAEQIAQSIVSRLLTRAEYVFGKVNERIASENNAENLKRRTIVKIAFACGQILSVADKSSFSIGAFDFEVRGENSIAIKSFGTDTETTLAIIALLRSRENKTE
jgi:hypothetical protein